jgi:hypothetical protein
MRKAVAPICPHCKQPSVLAGGDVIYPNWKDRHAQFFWQCAPCGAYVGTHKNTKPPLGIPANDELRQARILLHNRMVDPLWRTAVESVGYTPEDPKARKIIMNTARSRVYEFLAWKLGLDRDECHVAEFDLDMCRRAWRALQGVDYVMIRNWAKERKQIAA